MTTAAFEELQRDRKLGNAIVRSLEIIGEGAPPPPPKPKPAIEPVLEKQEFEIIWPNIIRIDHVYHPELHLDEEGIPAGMGKSGEQSRRFRDMV